MAIIRRNLGNVKGRQGDKGDQGDSYVLTTADKEEIAEQVADLSLVRNSTITLDCIHDYSGLPIWLTVTLKNAQNVVIVETEYQQGQVVFRVPPFENYTVHFDAPGYNAVSDISISPLQKTGYSQTIRFVPSQTVTFTVDYKNGDEVVQHNVVQPHASCTYEGGDISSETGIWVGWDDQSGIGSLTDIVENTVVNATFCVPQEPEEIIDPSTHTYLYSDFEDEDMCYTREEFAYILLNNLAKTYFAKGNLIKLKIEGWGVTTDTAMEMRLETFNHFKIANSDDFALTTWLMTGVLISGRRINPTNSNAGGWAASELNGLIDSTYFSKLPPFWRGLIKTVTVKSHYSEVVAGQMRISYSETERHLWLANYVEIFGGTGEPYYSEIDSEAEEKQFSYYVSNATRIKKTLNNTGAASLWWLRSPDAGGVTNFRTVNADGNATSYGATDANSLALGFCI